MQTTDTRSAALLAAGLVLGLAVLGVLLGDAAVRFKEYERTVAVKGLSEREYPADTVIWPIQFSVASNELGGLYGIIETNTAAIRAYLSERGIADGEITLAPPVIVDKAAQRYGEGPRAEFRYTALQTVTVYSGNVERVREAMTGLASLGRQGIALTGGEFENAPEYLFTRLNDVKPEMIQEATTKAREVAAKFAADSASSLGRIRTASQGQFTIEPRDKNNPHIKKVRVVSTVEYYLAD